MSNFESSAASERESKRQRTSSPSSKDADMAVLLATGKTVEDLKKCRNEEVVVSEAEVIRKFGLPDAASVTSMLSLCARGLWVRHQIPMYIRDSSKNKKEGSREWVVYGVEYGTLLPVELWRIVAEHLMCGPGDRRGRVRSAMRMREVCRVMHAAVRSMVEVSFHGMELSRHADAISLLSSVVEPSKIRRFNLCSTGLSNYSMQNLRGLTGLKRLDLCCNHEISSAGLSHISGLTSIENLHLDTCSLTGQSMASLVGMPYLSDLSLASVPIKDEGLVYISGLLNLKKLNLDYTGVTNDGLTHLARLSDIEKLSLKGCKDVTGKALASLRGMVKMTSLNLGQTAVADKGLSSLTRLKNLTCLDLSSTSVTDTGLVNLASCTRMEVFSISGCCNVTNVGVAYLSGMTSMRELDIGGTTISDSGLSSLAEMKHLSKLLLEDIDGVSDKGIAVLVANHANLRELDVGNTAITNGGISTLSNLRKLETLFIYGIEALSDDCVQYLIGIPSLKKVEASGTSVSPSGLDLLNKTLAQRQQQI